jgi:hypothetical protein
MDAFDRVVPVPQVEVVPNHAARRQIGRQRAPRTSCREHVEDGVQDLADIYRPWWSVTPGWSNQRRHQHHSASVRSLG